MFCVISKATYDYGDSNFHDIQTNSSWASNPYGGEYAVVPEEMIEAIQETRGFCDIKLNKEGTEVISFTAREIPIIEEPEVVPEPTTNEILNVLLGVE